MCLTLGYKTIVLFIAVPLVFYFKGPKKKSLDEPGRRSNHIFSLSEWETVPVIQACISEKRLHYF